MTGESAGAMIGGRYVVLETLGKGGFGRTFLARDRRTDERVAIKMLEPRRAESAKVYQLFEREATVLRSLRHHGVPEVLATLHEEWDGAEAAFLVMEYIEGVSLARVIEQRDHLEPAAVLHVLVEMLGILDYLHGRIPPVLHRDIKPANIVVRPDGSPALVDFGAVRNVFRSPEESGSTVAGTYGYMPYEQSMGQATPASDLYALGATFLHLLTGRAPPEFMTDEGRIEVPGTLPGGERLRAVIARMLLPSPAERFRTARDARDALLAGRPGTNLPVPARPSGLTALAGGRLAMLPPAPRALDGPTRELFDRVRPSAWDLMSASQKPGEGVGIGALLGFVFFSLITAGVLPIVFFSMAHERKRRLRPFFREGVPAAATISAMEKEDTAFGEKITRVSYEFEADGAVRRDADLVLPYIADRWRVGETVQVLYLADRDYDSVIVST